MVASARVAYLARRAIDYGVQTGPVKVNLAQVRERKQKVVERFRNGAEECLENYRKFGSYPWRGEFHRCEDCQS